MAITCLSIIFVCCLGDSPGKIVSGAFASVMGLVAHPDGTYCTSTALLCINIESGEYGVKRVEKVNNLTYLGRVRLSSGWQ